MTNDHIIQTTQELSGRWTIPILLTLQQAGGRFTPLGRQLDISPSRLSSNLKKLEEKGIIQHLSPYERRHPLLPEYRLTEKGLLLREAAKAIQSAETELGRGFLAERSWNWPVMLALYYQYNRFQAIRKLLQSATPRILTMRISELCEQEIAEKQPTMEPRPGYDYWLLPNAEPPVGRLEKDLCSLL
ncbi:transcriptional regulator [Xylanibacillus composti]|uniref:HTH hxlR-type domain-containing protein n=1 Tax=Xylanibacillus composti TaxID=1572762 RepID=A0A8J4M1J5_9BACL|nr:winged helix-turn-helix transcriptional regulator [Xylanibacillus composti]MDT9724886.1 transcriptional regulator [Xylanibacillus composti]GIQ68120.1 hypothetical protein XYCOK13_09440 [Xylanibacillus composti]